MTLRRLLDDDWDDSYESAERAVNIGVGIIIAIVVGIVLFVVIAVVICIYCVCKKRQASSGTVVQRGAPVQQVTTYNFQQTSQQQPGVVQPPQPQAYPQYPAGPQYPGPQYPGPQYPGPQYPGPQYPPPGPAQAYPPMAAGGWTKPDQGVVSPPPYTPQPAPVGLSEKQNASAPPME